MQTTIFDTLTPDDIRMLTETVDEESRRGNMLRIFPAPNTVKYLRFLEVPRYYNLLLDQWVRKYYRMESRGERYFNPQNISWRLLANSEHFKILRKLLKNSTHVYLNLWKQVGQYSVVEVLRKHFFKIFVNFWGSRFRISRKSWWNVYCHW